jgi:hypothetical protein
MSVHTTVAGEVIKISAKNIPTIFRVQCTDTLAGFTMYICTVLADIFEVSWSFWPRQNCKYMDTGDGYYSTQNVNGGAICLQNKSLKQEVSLFRQRGAIFNYFIC